jgi:hypothetical protein
MTHATSQNVTKKKKNSARRVRFMEQPLSYSRKWSKERRSAFKISVKKSVDTFDQIVCDRAIATSLDDLTL